MREVRPQAGPQEAFASCPADICIYGGAAGGGKSFGLLLEAARNVHVPGYAAVLFRRTNPELVGGGSIWEKSGELYPYLGGQMREGGSMDWRFNIDGSNKGSIIEFRHLQHDKDKTKHQGKQYAFVGFDELTTFTEAQFWYLVGRLRSTCGVKPYLRATCNPDPDSFVAQLIEWWIGPDGYPIQERSGVIRYFVRVDDGLEWADSPEELKRQYGQQVQPMSFTFIPSKLDDNQILMREDPGYEAKLLALPMVERMQLLHGNWKIRASAGLYFRKSMFTWIDEAPVADILMRVRAWDLAATKPTVKYPDPDWTVGTRMSITKSGLITVEHAEMFRENPHQIQTRIKNMAEADTKKTRVAMWEDPGAAGKAEISNYQRLLAGWMFYWDKANQDKLSFAKPFSAAVQAGNVQCVKGPWNDRYFSHLEAFPAFDEKGKKISNVKDDAVDSSSLGYRVLTNADYYRLKALAGP